MLTDLTLKALKPKDKGYKVSDKDGLYAYVSKTGAISFRYNYKINGRQETYSFGVWKKDLSLSEARKQLVDIKRLVASGISPMLKKRTQEKQAAESGTVGEWVRRYFDHIELADSTRKRKNYIVQARILEPFEKYKLSEITFQVLRKHIDRIEEEGAPATAIEVRNIFAAVFDFARDRGEDIENVARRIRPSSIHVFRPKERALAPQEIASLMYVIRKLSSFPHLKLALKVLLYTLVRKSMLLQAKWDEIDFEKATWTIPADHMKMGKPHVVYLSKQALDCFIGLEALAMGSEYVMPSRGNPFKCMSDGSLNRTCRDASKAANDYNLPLDPFSPHDLRRTGSTLLHEAGYESDVIEKALAHEQGGVRAVYNKAEYASQRKKMLQDWADMIDGWCEEYKNDVDESVEFKTVRQLRAKK